MRARSMHVLCVLAAAFLVAAAPSGPPVSPIADAAMRGDLVEVRRLIADRGDVNAAQGDGMTALHWAADHGDAAMTAALLSAKARVDAKTRIGGYTPLHLAARAGNVGVVQALLAAKADVKAATGSGATALHLAAASGKAEIVSALLEKGADPNARESASGQTPLIFAAELGRADAIRVLLKGGADPSIRTKFVDLSEQAAREQAAEKKRREVLIAFEPPARHDSAEADYKVALEAAKAARANAPPTDDGRGGGGGGRGNQLPTREPRGPFTPQQIQVAIDSGRVVFLSPKPPADTAKEVVDTLNGGVQGYAKQVGGVGGLTALHHAVRQGNVAAALALIEGGANIDDTSSADRTTPLLMATINGQFDVAIELVKRGANPNIASTSGMAPLYAAINTQWAPRSRFPQPQAIQTQKTTYLELVKAVLDKGADVNARLKKQPWYFAYNNCGNPNCGLENIDGTTAFWRAAYALDIDAMRLLVARGADPNLASIPPRVPARGGGGGAGGGGAARRDTAVAAAPATAAARPAGGGQAALPGFGPSQQFKLDPDIEVAAAAAPVGSGVFPIHAAAGVGYGNGFAGNSHRHAPDGWMPAMRYFVEELHADVNARDNNGYTPLHHAAARGDNEMILYLVAHGADVKAVSRNGRTVVDMANGPVQRLRPFPETIALLEKLGAKNQHHCVSC
jgi:uncharacterized protein